MEDPGKNSRDKINADQFTSSNSEDHGGGMERQTFSDSSVLVSNMQSLRISVQ